MKMKRSEIQFVESDKRLKNLRKDITYLCKVFGADNLPEWLIINVLRVNRTGYQGCMTKNLFS